MQTIVCTYFTTNLLVRVAKPWMLVSLFNISFSFSFDLFFYFELRIRIRVARSYCYTSVISYDTVIVMVTSYGTYKRVYVIIWLSMRLTLRLELGIDIDNGWT